MKKIVLIIGLLGFSAWAVLRAAEDYASASGGDDSAEVSQQDRMALRAFYTAPPVIPHLVTTSGNHECMVCHKEVLEISGRTTVPSPHLEMTNCQQCHVGLQGFNEEVELDLPETNWVGLQEPEERDRAFDGAPPMVPHRHFFRENCVACHRSDHPNLALRIDHQERSNCQQCHVTDISKEF